MDTYNENLQVTVNDTLDTMENELIADQSTLNASEFSLYYAQGARITAEITAADMMVQYVEAAKVGQQGVDNYNVASNLLLSANAASTALGLTTTNIATAATNVETAANSVALVAANMGAVFNLVSAEDYGTDIYTWSLYANALIKNTAYDAEVASQHGMEASSMTAEVTSATVAAKAANTQAAVKTLNDATGAQFATISEQVETAAQELAAASETEKAAEGVLMDNYVNTFAVELSYLTANEKLNFDLLNSDFSDKGFEVSFDGLNNPFNARDLRGVDTKPGSQAHVLIAEVVESYYVMVVKQDKANLFELVQAEALIGDDTKALPIHVHDAGTAQSYSTYIEVGGTQTDVDGDPIVLGQYYVTFVMAQYTDKFKKLVNNYNDFLSVASMKFILTNKLGQATDIKVDNTTQTVTFMLPSGEVNKNAEYHLMFLLKDPLVTTKMLTEPELKAIGEEVKENIENQIKEALEAIANENQQLKTKQDELEKLNQEKADLLAQIEAAAENDLSKTEVTKLRNATKDKDKLIEELIKLINEAEAILEEWKKKLEELLRKQKPQPGFYFNKTIAEQVTPANYTEAEGDPGKQVKLTYKRGLTDNFGTEVKEGQEYIPVVLTAPNVNPVVASSYSSNISDYKTQKTYVLFPEKEGEGDDNDSGVSKN